MLSNVNSSCNMIKNGINWVLKILSRGRVGNQANGVVNRFNNTSAGETTSNQRNNYILLYFYCIIIIKIRCIGVEDIVCERSNK